VETNAEARKRELLHERHPVVGGAHTEDVELGGVVGDFEQVGDGPEDLVVEPFFYCLLQKKD
jgi:hypothetical protein